ncbi:MAG: hypothetical protein OWQ57_10765 [Sulfobacillus sp.]|nr:hypothetical protein [Sulfobacillus sp.]
MGYWSEASLLKPSYLRTGKLITVPESLILKDIVDVVVASLAMKGVIGLGRRPKVLLVSVPMVGKAIP